MPDTGTNNADQTLIGTGGAIFTAPEGTPLPTTIGGALNSNFLSVGYITTEGPSMTVGKTTQSFGAWQSALPIAERVTDQTIQVNFSMLEWDHKTVPFAFGGGTVSTTAGGYKFEPADVSAVDERSLILAVTNGDVNWRFVFPRGYGADNADVTFNRTSMSALPIGFRVLAPADGSKPFYILTDSPSFDAIAAGS